MKIAAKAAAKKAKRGALTKVEAPGSGPDIPVLLLNSKTKTLQVIL